jgi:hypothetical protein
MTKETATRVEERGMSQRSEDLLQVYKTLTFDVPLASMRWVLGSANDKESTFAVWKGYDAGVRLATSTIDSLYRSQSLSEIVGNTVNQMLRLQQLGNAARSFFTANLWRPLAPPATPPVQPLTAPVQAMDAHLSRTTSVQTRARASRRSQRPGTHTQKPVQTPVHPLPQQDNLRAAA